MGWELVPPVIRQELLLAFVAPADTVSSVFEGISTARDPAHCGGGLIVGGRGDGGTGDLCFRAVKAQSVSGD